MDNLNEKGLVELSLKQKVKFQGGSIIRWRTLLKGARYLLEAAGAYEAYKDIKEGYNACRN